MKMHKWSIRFCSASVVLLFILLVPAYANDGPPPERTPTFGPDGGTATAAELAAAMDIPVNLIINASLGTSDPTGTNVFTPLGGFPTQGNSFAAISSGNAANASLPNNTGSLSTILDGLNNSQGNDLVQLTLTLRVPPGAAFWAVDWKFLSEEYPEWVGTPFNDAFLIETPSSTFAISGISTITAPNNVAFDPRGELVTINTTGVVGMTAANAAGTTYDGATARLVTAAAIRPGATQVTIILSVMDLGDSIFDTTVFLDNFRFVTQVPSPALPAQIKVPIRWCGIGNDDDGNGTIDRGAPSIINPALVGESFTNGVLRRRLERLSDNVYMPQANMAFRRGGNPFLVGNLPIIPDPNTTIGEVGDAVMEINAQGVCVNCAEPISMVNACRRRWEELDNSVKGIVAVHINRFVNSNGTPNKWLGFAQLPTLSDAQTQLNYANAVVIDNAYLLPSSTLPSSLNRGLPATLFKTDPDEKWLGHEFGHTLTLLHGNGIDDDGDGRLDEPGEDSNPTSGSNLMQYQPTGITITRAQSDRIRIQALTRIPDRDVDPVTPPLGDSGVDAVMDVPSGEEFIDIDPVGVVVDDDQGTTTLSLGTAGLLPRNISNADYFFLADLDNDPMTGGLPADIGIPTTLVGIELIGKVRVSVLDGVVQAAPTVWIFQGGQFVMSTDPQIEARVIRVALSVTDPEQSGVEIQVDIGEDIQLTLPNTVRGAINTEFRIAAIAQNVNSGNVDEAGALLTLAIPTFPSCQVTPIAAIPGDTAIVEATDLLPSRTGEVFIGEELVATGSTDPAGNAAIPFVIPSNAVTGNRLVGVGVENTDVAAYCSVFITQPPVFNIPPTPLRGTEFTVRVGDTVNFFVQASDPDAVDIVTLGAIDLPTGATFISTSGNPASATFSWTPMVGQAGVYIVPFTATDEHGISTQPLSIVITVVQVNTAPTANAGGPYNVSEGSSVVLSGSGTDPDGDPLTFSWDLDDDGTFETAGQDPIFSAAGRDGPGSQTVVLQVCDNKGACATSSTTVSISNAAPQVSSNPMSQAVQYSDPIGEVTIAGMDVVGDMPLAISSQWSMDGGAMTPGLPTWLTQASGGCTTSGSDGTCTWTLAGTALTAPGMYVVRVTLSDDDGGSTDHDISINVAQEDARVTYTGALFASTASASSSTANVTLAVTVQDISVTPDAAGDTYPGDIRNAMVTFVDRDSGNAVLCTAAVGLVSAADLQTGTATCTWTASLGSQNSIVAHVGIIVNGYYTRNSTDDDTMVTVSKPLTSNFITGGGYIVLSNSVGLKAGDVGSKNNFGFNIKFNKSGTNLQGNINIIVRRTESDGLHVYQIKGNVMTSLAVQPGPGTATFNGRANIQDITNPLAPISVDGNATLQVTMDDNGEPGSSDTIGITIWNKSGGLWFASQWDGTTTVEQSLNGGNLVVH